MFVHVYFLLAKSTILWAETSEVRRGMCCLVVTNQRPVSRSLYHSRPMRGLVPGGGENTTDQKVYQVKKIMHTFFN